MESTKKSEHWGLGDRPGGDVAELLREERLILGSDRDGDIATDGWTRCGDTWEAKKSKKQKGMRLSIQ